MRNTFNLKEPNKDGETLILFSAYFKNEGRKFVYSTGETVNSKDWDFENRQPKNLNGRTEKAKRQRGIKRQLDRYSTFFSDLIQQYKLSNREIIITDIKDDFDKEFKRTKAIASKFFEVYDLFLTEKKNDYTEGANSETTIKRYEYNKKLLEGFEVLDIQLIHYVVM